MVTGFDVASGPIPGNGQHWALVARVLRLGCRPWFGFVYSEDNLSDLPSRELFGLLKWLGSTRRVLVRPSLATLGSDEPDVPGYAG